MIGGRKLWGRVSRLVGRHARRVWVVTALALLAAGAFLPTFKAEGNSQEDLFLNEVESVTGQEVLARHGRLRYAGADHRPRPRPPRY